MTIELPADAWHGHATESVFVEGLGQDRYRLQNSPFFATGLSYRDIVIARQNGPKLLFEKLLFIGGHSTYRIIPSDDADHRQFRAFLARLEDIGCSWEHGNLGYMLYAVDVPPETNIHTAYELLEAGEAAGIWDFEEGAVGHLVVKS
ncbi:DUF4265 domain-containing protein [Thalassovita aquimarina]|uniref:DUF4265 domain-containing protein n=1 Tax=Thalassovita aquimarina TaxID=2785917 RepID=UPI003568B419